MTQTSTGNGSMSGPDYTLEIIGVPKGKSAPMTNNNGHRIFVSLNGASDIWLCYAGLTLTDATLGSITCPNQSFGVLDANATDTSSAQMCAPGGSATGQNTIDYLSCGGGLFELPQPGTYAVYGRTLAKPGGSATQNTCATYYDSYTNQTVVICSSNTLSLKRNTGKSTFVDVSSYLLNMTISSTYLSQFSGLATCLANEGYNTSSAVSVPIFDSCLQNYFWYYDNNGLKHYQLFFFQQ